MVTARDKSVINSFYFLIFSFHDSFLNLVEAISDGYLTPNLPIIMAAKIVLMKNIITLKII